MTTTKLKMIFTPRETTRRCGGHLLSLIASLAALTSWAGTLQAATLHVPNGSFETPVTDFADPRMDAWQKSPQPFWYDDQGGFFPWAYVMGQFLNTSNGSPDHIDNVDGKQASYMYALPQVAIFQDYNTLSGTNTTPSHAFNAKFEVGKSYALTVGVLGGGGGMSNGATFAISLYYRDVASNMVTIGSTTITNSKALFPTNTHLTDFSVQVPPVRAGDLWAGKNIGIQLASTIGFDKIAGYWDVDNVRLTESLVPNGSFESPETDFAMPVMDAWQKSPQPFWYDDQGGFFPWSYVMGEFLNTSNGSPNHIDNMEGKQAAYMYALPQVAVFQDYNTLAEYSPAPTHDFNVKFEVGRAYTLTVGVLGGGGGMSNGATFAISLYYRDASSNMVTVGATTITNSPALFPTNTHFTDFQVRVPSVKTNDAWAGKNIGIQLASTIGFDKIGGYWDVDNVRLVETVVPNGSFESPETDFASPLMDAWQKSPQPFWYDDQGGFFPWSYVMGEFLNTSNGAPDHIDNVDGKQASYMYALPQLAIFQDDTTSPAHDFNTKFEVGKSYALTVGVLGGGGGMSNGATFAISLYYRDAASNMVTVASTTITNRKALFPTNTHLTDFQALVPDVKSSDAWAGKNIGIQLASTIGFDKIGGYWDVDNVRLQVFRDPALTALNRTNGQFKLALGSDPGRFDVLASTDITLATPNWTNLGTVTNYTGSVSFTDTNSALGRRFYQARPSP